MKVTVYHGHRAVAIVDSPFAEVPDDYHLEYAFEATQNRAVPWSWEWGEERTPTVDPPVIVLGYGEHHSTTVGDQMVLENGRCYRVDPEGFSRLAWKEDLYAV